MIKRAIYAVVLAFVGMSLFATVSEPEHIFFGFVRNGTVVLNTGTVTVRINGDPTDAASYTIGSVPLFGSRYVLRVPLSSVTPRIVGTAQTGDQAAFYYNGALVGTATVGDRGTPQQVDLDTNFQGVPALTVGDTTIVEGNTGTTAAAFTVSIAFATNRDVTFSYATADVSAVAPGDYLAASGIGTIATGQTTTTVAVSVVGDTLPEASEQFSLTITNVMGATAADGLAAATIIDDDTVPALTINDASVLESDTTNRTLRFTIAMNATRSLPVTVQYNTSNLTATEGADYLAATGTATVAAGSLTTTVDVTVLPDNLIEADETLAITLSNPQNAIIGDLSGVGTIVDDDRLLTQVEVQKEGVASVQGISGVAALAISPNGQHLYAAGQSANAVAVFNRNGANGRLSFVQAVVNGAGGVAGIGGAKSIAVSSDGNHVYVAGSSDSSIAVFARNSVSGLLAFVEVQRNGFASVVGLGNVAALALSADGKNLYAVSPVNNTLVVFSREAVTGRLSFLETHFDGEDGVDGLAGASGVTAAVNGTSVFVAGGGDAAVSGFARDSITGRLTFRDVLKESVGGVSGLLGAASVAATFDHRHTLVAGQSSDALAVFARNTGTGALGFAAAYPNLAGGVEGLNGISAVSAARNGRYIYTAARDDSALAVFSRNAIDGVLSFREVERDGQRGLDGLAGASAVVVSPDDRFIYVAGSTEDAIAVFELTDLGGLFDPNGDGMLTIADVLYLISYLFGGGPPPVGRGDADGDGVLTIADIFFLVNHFFAGGSGPS